MKQIYPKAFHLFFIAKKKRNLLDFSMSKRYIFTMLPKSCTLLQNSDYISFFRFYFQDMTYLSLKYY